MSERHNNFDLKLLTSSKEVGLRRLRSYSASLGGGAQIYNTYDDLRRNLEAGFCGKRANIVLHDGSVPLLAAQLQELQRFARVFMLRKPQQPTSSDVPARSAPCWQVESFMQCSLGVFLDSPVIRMSMASMCRAAHPFQLEHLLRWGHASSTWNASDLNLDVDLGDASFRFVRTLNLVGEGRRLTEMFTHFTAARLPELGLSPESVTFGADGLLITVIARCRVADETHIRDVAQELRIHDFPIAITNRLGDGTLEIAALHYPYQAASVGDERILMVFNKSTALAAPAKAVDDAQDQAVPAANLLNRAG